MLDIASQIASLGNWKKAATQPAPQRPVGKGKRIEEVAEYMRQEYLKDPTIGHSTVEVAAALGTSHGNVSHAMRRCGALGFTKKLGDRKHGKTIVGVWIYCGKGAADADV